MSMDWLSDTLPRVCGPEVLAAYAASEVDEPEEYEGRVGVRFASTGGDGVTIHAPSYTVLADRLGYTLEGLRASAVDAREPGAKRAQLLRATPELRSLLKRARAWNDEARAELEQLGEKAEEFADYRHRDERSADHGETAWELLAGLLGELEDIR